MWDCSVDVTSLPWVYYIMDLDNRLCIHPGFFSRYNSNVTIEFSKVIMRASENVTRRRGCCCLCTDDNGMEARVESPPGIHIGTIRQRFADSLVSITVFAELLIIFKNEHFTREL